MRGNIPAVFRTLLFGELFVLISAGPAGGYGDVKLFLSPLTYSMDSTVLLNDVLSGDKEVGYKVKSKLSVDPVWSDSASHFLLKFQLQSPKLHVRSRTAPHEGFVEHASLLDSYENGPFFAEWKDGTVRKVYIDTKEDAAWINYKKAVASVFQFQILDQDEKERDISGICDTSYHSLSPTVIRKVKTNCMHEGASTRPPEGLLSTDANSARMTRYEFSEDFTAVKRIYAEEIHHMKLGMKRDVGNKIRVWQDLTLLEDNSVSSPLKSKSLKDALPEAEATYGFVMKEQDLQLNIVDEKEKPSYNLANLIKENRDYLRAENMGKETATLAFMRILKAMRSAKSDDILKVMKGVKNKEILEQLCDLVGYTQTSEAHRAVKEFLNFESEFDKNYVERYLWALSVGPRPCEKVILDVLKMSEITKTPDHISDTLLYTASAMTYRLTLNRGDNSSDFVSNRVKNHITSNLSKCKESQCIIKYLKALQNLKRPDTVDILIDYAKKGQRSVATMALKALRAMPEEFWNEKVRSFCKKVFFQLDKRYDSSARCLAIDIVLESRPAFFEIEELLDFLTSADKDFEVKQFLLQRLQMNNEKCGHSKKNFDYLLKKHRYINNYNVLAQKGLSTALSRTVSANAWSNVSLVSVQEISGGVLKRGHVDLIIEDSGRTNKVFGLGLFAEGLSSMVGDSGNSEEQEEEPSTAGMELYILGVHIRPFVFFSGQAELMGHVWSGTASERTAAFQSLMLIQEEQRGVVLGSGSIARHSLTAAASVDLAGQIQLSLWSRTAHSVVDQAAGIVVEGTFSADTPFVRSRASFALGVEPALDLESDIDFYDGVKLCIQVKQPDLVVRHNITKVESIPSYSQAMRKSKFRKMSLPGRTYALNRKNNLMCNDIHNKK